MMNDWADIFPPRAEPQRAARPEGLHHQTRHECEQQRGLLPNLILTDYYDRGKVAEAAAELNGVAGKKPVETRPVG